MVAINPHDHIGRGADHQPLLSNPILFMVMLAASPEITGAPWGEGGEGGARGGWKWEGGNEGQINSEGGKEREREEKIHRTRSRPSNSKAEKNRTGSTIHKRQSKTSDPAR